MKRLLVWFGVLLVVASPLVAADRYVRAGATGANNGTDWTNAWTNFNQVVWSQIGSGSTLWIAAGTYTGIFPTVNVAGITVRRATIGAHGSDTGWQASYDGQVTANPSDQLLFVDANNFTLDGVGGCGSPWRFKLNGSPGSDGQIGLSATNITIRGIEMDGSSRGGGEDAFRGGWSNDQINDLIIECNYIHDYSDYAGIHNDGIQLTAGNRVIFRYNVWSNCGQHIFLGDNAWCGSGCWVNDAEIYYNIFYNTIGTGWGSYNTISCKDCNQTSSNYTRVFNNVFAMRFSDLGAAGFRNAISWNNMNTAQLSFRNNIVIDTSLGGIPSISSANRSNNSYFNNPSSAPSETGRVISDPQFVNYAGNNYHLQSTSPNINAGFNVGLTRDLDGNTVPQGGVPEIGAYEFLGTAPPNPPTNLRAVVL